MGGERTDSGMLTSLVAGVGEFGEVRGTFFISVTEAP